MVAAGVLAAAIAGFSQAPTELAPWRPDVPLGLDLYLPMPENNPLTVAKVAVGRRLFFDPILSRDYKLACASCHNPARAFTDGRTIALGVFGRQGTRNVPALINRGYGAAFFWDGRTTTLEEQVVKPIQDRKEMDMTLEEAIARLKEHGDYPALFLSAFAREVNPDDLARALASYVRTILSGDAPIDRYLHGDAQALSNEAREGLRVFRGKANCTACHLGPNFTDEQFHNTGIAWREGQFVDPGRFAVTGKEADRGAFKTATLREVARTAPYMHDGSLATLEEVVEFYNRGGNLNPHLDSEIRPLNLTAEEKAALTAFLESLTGNIREGMLIGRTD
ncbi:MAG: cytochrome-c peroxidase [Acidobacteria bacterium]|nr:cytochrome-c peroxidase [Acidobacteriota bacterium]